MSSEFDVDAARSSFEGYNLQDNTQPIGGMVTTASWSAAEDYDLCYIYCSLSVDPIRGADQSAETFWGRITNCFNRKNMDRKRSLSSVKGRYSKINRQTQTFDSQMFKLKQTNPSGFGSETHMRLAANKLFKQIYKPDSKQQPHFYQFMHVYDLLVNHVKWKSSLQQTVQDVQSYGGRGKASRVGESSSPRESLDSFGLGSEEDLTPTDDRYVRPICAKAAKNKMAAKGNEAKIEKLLQESNESYERAMESRAVQHQERLCRLDQLLAGNRQRDEDALMLMDTSHMSEEQRQYTESRRREIMRRRIEEGL